MAKKRKQEPTIDLAEAAPDELVSVLTRKFESYKSARAEFENEWVQDYDTFMATFKAELKTGEGQMWRSRANHPMTRIKVNIAVSQMSDVWFRGGRFPYMLKNTPVPDSPINEEMEMLGFDMTERLHKMSQRIDDQLIEARTNDELLACGQGCALFGTGVMRGPFVEMRKRYRYVGVLPDEIKNMEPPMPQSQDPQQAQEEAKQIMEQQRELFKQSVRFEQEEFTEPAPTFRNADIWDFFADPESSGDTQRMSGMFYRQHVTNAEFADLKDIVGQDGKPIYNAEAIDAILLQDSIDTMDSSVGPHRIHQVDQPERVIEVIEYCGKLTKKDLKNHIQIRDEIKDIDPIEVIITFCREKILRVTENKMPGKMRPYHMVQWERIPGTPYGRGLGRNLRDPQSLATGFMRAYIDNKNLAGAGMLAIRAGSLDPMEDASPMPGKVLKLRPEVRDVREAIQQFVFPDVGSSILEAIDRSENLGDTASGIPKALEGQAVQGPQETAFEINQRITSAAKQIGLVLKYFDERIVCPMIRALYHWNMAMPIDPDMRGDYEVHATGFSSYQDRVVKGTALRNFLGLIGNLAQAFPELQAKYDTAAIVNAIARTEDIDPEELLRDEDEANAMLEQQQQAVAQAQAELAQAQQEKNQLEQAKIQSQAQIAEGKRKADLLKAKLKAEVDLEKHKQKALPEPRPGQPRPGQPRPPAGPRGNAPQTAGKGVPRAR